MSNGWKDLTDWQEYVIVKLDRIDEALGAMSNEVTALRVKIAFFGSAAGLIAGIVGGILVKYLSA